MYDLIGTFYLALKQHREPCSTLFLPVRAESLAFVFAVPQLPISANPYGERYGS